MKRVAWTSFGSLCLCSLCLLGCGGGNNDAGCVPTAFQFAAGPASGTTATPDHAAPSPGNQEQFLADAGGLSGPGCATPLYINSVPARWTTSDPVNVQIGSAPDASNGLATCKGPTDGVVTLTAWFTQQGITETAKTSITCE